MRWAERASSWIFSIGYWRCERYGLGIVAAERAAELHGTEAELIAELIGGFGEAVELFATVGLQKIKLFRAVAQTGQRYTEQTNFSLGITVSTE